VWKARCQRRSSHLLAVCTFLLHHFFGNDNKQSILQRVSAWVDFFWSGFKGLMYGLRMDDRSSIDATREQLQTAITVVYRYSGRCGSR
jgi:hypothetical protein